MIQITLNSKVESTPATNLFELLELKALAKEKAIAVALNEEVVSKEDWQSTPLTKDDQILIIKPTQGG